MRWNSRDGTDIVEADDHRARSRGPSVFGKLVVRIAVEPALAGLGRRNDRMPGRTGVLRSMTVRRVVTTVGTAAVLTGTQMHPRSADLDALLALTSFWLLDG